MSRTNKIKISEYDQELAEAMKAKLKLNRTEMGF